MGCRTCDGELSKILSLGTTPLANAFLSKENLNEEEPRFPLEIYFCPMCKLVQLGHVVPPEIMFSHYVYVTSTTKTFQIHFTQYAEDVTNQFTLDSGSLVVDIGSNDGLLLKGFQKNGVQVIGVEPAENIAKIAEDDGVETINDFFNAGVVQKILDKKGKADVVTANNVFAHIDNIHDVTKNVKDLIKEDGVFIIEFQYFVDTIEKMTFDNIYHEHLSYFTLTSIINFFKKHDMAVFHAERNDSHGGSLRVFVKKSGSPHPITPAIQKLLDHEHKMGIEHFALYQQFADVVYATKEKFVKHLETIRESGKTIAAYGAPAKGNTLLNFCEIGKETISYIVDDNPLKEGLFAPGTRIPVVHSHMLDQEKPDYVVILAWNFAKEILEKTKKYADQGVKFIIPLPEPIIV